MRIAVVFALLCFFAPVQAKDGPIPDSLGRTASSRLKRDLWFGKDKADHFLVSTFLTGFAYYASRQEGGRSQAAGLNIAVGFSFSLGVGKELYDALSGRGRISWKDLVADVAGTGVGYAICSAGVR